jgi:hypothetical protein
MVGTLAASGLARNLDGSARFSKREGRPRVLTIVEVDPTRSQNLVILVPFSSDEHEIVGGRFGDRLGDNVGPMGISY